MTRCTGRLLTALLAATLLLSPGSSSSVSADLTGAGLEEIGVFGVETAGAARGAWFQAFDGEGERLASFFLGTDLTGPRAFSADLDADGDEEIAAAARGVETGAVLAVRDAEGAPIARRDVLEGQELASIALLEVARRGSRPWLGLAYVTVEGNAGLQLWALTDEGRLRQASETELIGEEESGHVFRAVDLDADGDDEIFVGSAAATGRGSTLRVFEARATEPSFVRNAAGRRFEAADWVIGEFRPEEPGLEIVAGVERRSNGAGRIDLYSASGDRLLRKVVTPRGGDATWRAAAAPGETGGGGIAAGDQLLVGYRTAAGNWGYVVWDFREARPVLATRRTNVLPVDQAEVHDWVVGDLDGDATTGDEAVVLYTDTADRSIRYQQWSRENGVLQGAGQVLSGRYFSPVGQALRILDADRDDLVVVAGSVGRTPRAVVLSTPGAGDRLLELDILSSGVR